MTLPVHGDAANLAENPVVRQRLRPGRIDRECRHVFAVCGDANATEAMQIDMERVKCASARARRARRCVGAKATSQFLLRLAAA